MKTLKQKKYNNIYHTKEKENLTYLLSNFLQFCLCTRNEDNIHLGLGELLGVLFANPISAACNHCKRDVPHEHDYLMVVPCHWSLLNSDN